MLLSGFGSPRPHPHRNEQDDDSDIDEVGESVGAHRSLDAVPPEDPSEDDSWSGVTQQGEQHERRRAAVQREDSRVMTNPEDEGGENAVRTEPDRGLGRADLGASRQSEPSCSGANPFDRHTTVHKGSTHI